MRKKACQALEIGLMDMALGNLDETERREVETHLQTCGGCRAMYQEMRLMAAEAVLSSRPVQAMPPAGLKERLMRRVMAEQSGKKRTAGWLKGVRSPYLLPVMGMALVLFFLWAVPSVGNVVMTANGDNPWQMTQRGETEQYPIKQSIVLSRLKRDDGGLRLVSRRGAAEESGVAEIVPVEGSIWVNRQTGEVLLVVDGLKPLINADYQAWVAGDGREESAGIMKVVARHSLLYYHGRSRMEAESVWLTIEPAGGRETPTGPKVLQVDFE